MTPTKSASGILSGFGGSAWKIIRNGLMTVNGVDDGVGDSSDLGFCPDLVDQPGKIF